ncbi:MAG: 2-dehydro-3-deoxy-6-phosphogalactonate aldolase [Kiritimatiellae bacterium]|jgi:2-dehydro-3-deoxyphosphogalactonate aldolase|nr:2-dehydro-3-deoxy-6-phosphogalactonate aldolase [Kiritimatiellia bacterium]
MNKNDMSLKLKSCPIVAILRGITPSESINICQALADGGIKLIEITMNSPSALESIELVAKHFENADVEIGAGTVLTPEEVKAVQKAGGKYIISPNCNPAVIQKTKELGLLSLPGVFTVSEAFTALESGADFLKLFPAGRLAPEYIKDMKAVVPADFLAVGGVSPSNLNAYLQYTVGAGIGSALYKTDLSMQEIKSNAENLLKLIK